MDQVPLDAAALRSALVRPGSLWRDVGVVASTPSTNADLVAAAGRGDPEGMVEVAEHQSAGRGRLARAWTAPPEAALTFSVLLRPDGLAAARWSWLPLLTGVAVAAAVREPVPSGVTLKWPNDVLLGGRKLAGILAERAGGGVVVGIGLNVWQRTDELPGPDATSLRLAGVPGGGAVRFRLLVAVLESLAAEYLAWRDAGGDAVACGLAERYRQECATLGRTVRVRLPGGGTLQGVATGVTVDGALVVRAPDGREHTLAAGDVVHVRGLPT